VKRKTNSQATFVSHIILIIFKYNVSLKDLPVNEPTIQYLVFTSKSGIVIILVVILFINLFFQISLYMTLKILFQCYLLVETMQQPTIIIFRCFETLCQV
jgi:hypothetical protein